MEHVEPRVNARLDVDGLAFELEVAVQRAAPHIERLSGRLEIREPHLLAVLGEQVTLSWAAEHGFALDASQDAEAGAMVEDDV